MNPLLLILLGSLTGWLGSKFIGKPAAPTDVWAIVQSVQVIRPWGYGFQGEFPGPLEAAPVLLREEIWGAQPNIAKVWLFSYQIPEMDSEAIMSVLPWYSKPAAIQNTWPWLNTGEYLVEIQTGTLTSVNIAGELFATFPLGMVSRKLQIVNGAVVNLGGIVQPP